MFSQRKPPERGQAKTDPAAPAAPQRPARGGPAAPSILSADIELVGNLSTSGDIHVDGVVSGNLRASAIVVGDTATVTGDIVADDVTIYGRVVGHLFARRVKLCAKSHVEGDIQHETLTVEHGAHFDGNCRHSAEPIPPAKSAPKLLGGGWGAQRATLPAAETKDDDATTILGDIAARRRP